MFYVYILKSIDSGKYYIGQTGDIDNRITQHNSGKVSFTKRFMPWRVEFYLLKSSRREALILERKLKNLNREDLEIFIKKYKN